MALDEKEKKMKRKILVRPIGLNLSVGSGGFEGDTLSPLPAVKIGGITATVKFAGLIFPGEYQAKRVQNIGAQVSFR